MTATFWSAAVLSAAFDSRSAVSFYLCNFFRSEAKRCAPDDAIDLLRITRADNCAGDCRVPQGPGDGDSSRRLPATRTDSADSLNQRQILR
jgi:hypothetical protein